MTTHTLTTINKHFGMFLRPTGEGYATRYGTPQQRMGKVRDPKTGEVSIDTESIVALSHHEARRYRRGYARQVREGCVVECEPQEYLAFLEASAVKEKKAVADAKKIAKKKTDAIAKAKKEAATGKQSEGAEASDD